MKRIYAFWSISKFIFIEFLALVLCILIIPNNYKDLHVQHIALIALTIIIPLLFFLVDKVEIKIETLEFNYFTIKRYNSIDYNWNWKVYKNEVLSIEVIRLTNKEKKYLTSSIFLFHKYLQLTLNSGKKKYIYISNYSNKQIQRIISFLKSTG